MANKKTVRMTKTAVTPDGVAEVGEHIALSAYDAKTLVRLGKAEYVEETDEIVITGEAGYKKLNKPDLFTYIYEQTGIRLGDKVTKPDAILLLEDDSELADYVTEMLDIELDGNETRDEIIEMIRAQQD